MKFNWGVKIVLLYISFIVLILSMVAFFMTRDVDLVSVHYYDEEIKYEDKIDRIKRTEALGEKVNVQWKERGLELHFPKAVVGEGVSGWILFYRPSDRKLDFKLLVSADSSGSQVINNLQLLPGFWKVEINWKARNQEYFSAENLTIRQVQ